MAGDYYQPTSTFWDDPLYFSHGPPTSLPWTMPVHSFDPWVAVAEREKLLNERIAALEEEGRQLKEKSK